MKDTAILITRDGMGDAPPELQKTLILNYLKLLIENDLKPLAICFYAEGVKLVVQGSTVLEQLKTLEARGVPLLTCMTCLRFYNLTDEVRTGIVGGMDDILSAQKRAGKVITL
ncbi:MAG: DsrE family protein [Proteobacteria bacterium]|nr:DsrE family protein [Pseudomonadota bacterium]